MTGVRNDWNGTDWGPLNLVSLPVCRRDLSVSGTMATIQLAIPAMPPANNVRPGLKSLRLATRMDQTINTSDILADMSDTLQDMSDTLQDMGDTLQDMGDTLQDMSDTLQDMSDILQDMSDILQDMSDTLQDMNRSTLNNYKSYLICKRSGSNNILPAAFRSECVLQPFVGHEVGAGTRHICGWVKLYQSWRSLIIVICHVMS